MADDTIEVSTEEMWLAYGHNYDWSPPPKAAWPYRLPVVRFARFLVNAWRVERHYSMCIGIRTGYDNWVLFGMARGWV